MGRHVYNSQTFTLTGSATRPEHDIMTPPTSAPFGTWKSPITARLMTEGAVGLGGLKADGDCLYWLESRPSEAGRSVLVCRTPDGAVTDLTPAPFNVRTSDSELTRPRRLSQAS